MKKTIKEDKERRIIKEEILNDNNLIQYEYDNDNVLLVERFIKDNTIQENVILTMTLDEYNNELDRIVKFNKNNSAIAIFQKETYGYGYMFNEYNLRDCYDLREHSFSSSDFLDIDYNEKFRDKVNKILVVKKKK